MCLKNIRDENKTPEPFMENQIELVLLGSARLEANFYRCLQFNSYYVM